MCTLPALLCVDLPGAPQKRQHVCPHHQGGNQVSESLSILPKMAQLVSGRLDVGPDYLTAESAPLPQYYMPFLIEHRDCAWNLRCCLKCLLHHSVKSCIPELVFLPSGPSLATQTRSDHPAAGASLTALCPPPRGAESAAPLQAAHFAALWPLPKGCQVLCFLSLDEPGP